MTSGVKCSDDVVSKFQEIKIGHKYKYVTYNISDDLSQIETESTVQQGSWDDFCAALPPDGCRYAVYDFDYELPDGGKRNKLIFVNWCPDSAKIKLKMLYATSKDAIKKKLVGIGNEVQATGLDELNYDEILEKISRGGKN
ncbi:uncharacterized protein LOC100367892 [Saccoglossus kowalevskii]|uniref:Cofilin-like n=1 Tax=Saccoglossus kowalevskii TaxID=10224 RepID=A0ABM0GW59_SACKO|nr:PREDICTED: cofilin-like [Saccoglossus kowalevskii]